MSGVFSKKLFENDSYQTNENLSLKQDDQQNKREKINLLQKNKKACGLFSHSWGKWDQDYLKITQYRSCLVCNRMQKRNI